MRTTSTARKERWIFESKYVIFYWKWCFDISFEICGYFDNRPRINLDIIFFNLTLILPFRNKWKDECDCPKWGIAIHNNTFWVYKGGKGNMNGGNRWWTAYMPWSYQWVRTSYLRKDGTWEHESEGNRKDMYEEKWLPIIWNETYDYTYVLKSGTVQKRKALLKVVEREWRWHWFKWLPLTKMVRKTIDITFDDEVGERTGSWKGGTLGCGYNMKKGELPEQTLRRMEKERKM